MVTAAKAEGPSAADLEVVAAGTVFRMMKEMVLAGVGWDVGSLACANFIFRLGQAGLDVKRIQRLADELISQSEKIGGS